MRELAALASGSQDQVAALAQLQVRQVQPFLLK